MGKATSKKKRKATQSPISGTCGCGCLPVKKE